jgi:predicted phosphodiesterase
MKSSSNVKVVDFPEIKILPLYDLHVGSSECDEDLIDKAIKFIKENENCFTVLGGDLIENNVYDNKINAIHGQKYQVQEQVEKVIKMLEPIKDKILFSVCGNHEYRTERLTGVDISALIALQLDVPYFKWESFFMIKMPSKKNISQKRNISLYAHHGVGGSSTTGTKLNSIEKLHFRAPISDILMVGHHHISISSRKIIRFLNQSGQVKEMVQHFVGCGSAHQSTSEGYGAKGGYAPIPTGFSLINISLDSHDVIKCRTEVFE